MAGFSQFDSQGGLRHLTTLEGLDAGRIRALLDRAQQFLRPPGEIPVHSRALEGITVGAIFTEPSTRTRSSFEFAAKSLGAITTLVQSSGSSIEKGESVLDTGYTLRAVGADCIVMRHPSAGAPHLMARHLDIPVINAGDPTPTNLTEFDQRGPGFARVIGHRIDIGAVEYQSVVPGRAAAMTTWRTRLDTPLARRLGIEVHVVTFRHRDDALRSAGSRRATRSRRTTDVTNGSQ